MLFVSGGFNGEVTGIERFDVKLFQNDEAFEFWRIALSKRGYTLSRKTLEPNSFAFTDPEHKTVVVDPDITTYAMFLHERHHLRQFIRLERQGYNVLEVVSNSDTHEISRIGRWLELGAYEYLERLGRRYGFSLEYMHYLENQKAFYWGKSLRSKYQASTTTRKKFDAIWK